MSTKTKNNIYVTEMEGKAPNTDNIMLKGAAIPKGQIVELSFIVMKDETTAGKTIRIGYERNGTQYWLTEEPASTNFHGISFTGTLLLVEEELPIGMVESPTSNDVIRLFARGTYI